MDKSKKHYRMPLSYHSIDPEAYACVLDRYSTRHHGALVDDFEQEIANKSGARYVVGVNSGTSALHLALRLLGVEKNDRVLVSTFTYVASINPILYCGAIPTLIDSEQASWNMDSDLLEKAIAESVREGHKPKAIIVVYAYGVFPDLARIMALADCWDIPIIEDAAEAFGSSWLGRMAGTHGTLGVYSFNSNKTFTGLGGGALVMQDDRYVQRARLLARHAREDKGYYSHRELGYNYALSPLIAAYVLAQLPQCDTLFASRRNTFLEYKKEMEKTPEWAVSCQRDCIGVTSVRWLSTFSFATTTQCMDTVVALATQHGIELRRLWKPMHRQPLCADMPSYLNGVADHLFHTGLCLPSGNSSHRDKSELVDWLREVL